MREGERGVTLIELLVALVISSFFLVATYQTFFRQQKVYTVQEQVADMQQNVRTSISRMMDELRMTGFGNVSMVLPATMGGRTFANVVNADSPVTGAVTVVGALGGRATITGYPAKNQVVVDRLSDDQGNALFDTGNRKYISVGGLESHTIFSIDTGTKTLTVSPNLRYTPVLNQTQVFGIRAVTYQVVSVSGVSTLERDENLGDGPQALADNIESVQFVYQDANGAVTATPANVRIIRASATARTKDYDPELKKGGGDGYRRRQVVSNINLRNMGINP